MSLRSHKSLGCSIKAAGGIIWKCDLPTNLPTHRELEMLPHISHKLLFFIFFKRCVPKWARSTMSFLAIPHKIGISWWLIGQLCATLSDVVIKFENITRIANYIYVRGCPASLLKRLLTNFLKFKFHIFDKRSDFSIGASLNLSPRVGKELGKQLKISCGLNQERVK